MTTAHLPGVQLQALTHGGWVRRSNEDAFGLHPDSGLAILADGLGGGRAGEVASNMAVALLGQRLTHPQSALRQPDTDSEGALLAREQALRKAVAEVNAHLHRQAAQRPEWAGMGTTLVIAHWCGLHLLVGHLGDSRAYRARTHTTSLAGRQHHRVELESLTRDHSTAQRNADSRRAFGVPDPSGPGIAGAEPVRLTRALGVEADVVLELHRHRLAPGDLVLLCSDGLTDMLGEAHLEATLTAVWGREAGSAQRLEHATQALLQAALDAGGRDNITVVLGLHGPGPGADRLTAHNPGASASTLAAPP